MNKLAPIVIAKNRVARARIMQTEFTRASDILLDYIEKITGAKMIVSNVDFVDPFFFFDKVDHGKDGFAYYMTQKDIHFEAGNEQAAVYAVYDFLERVIGCRYYTKDYEYIPKDSNLTVHFDRYEFKPILEYREVYYRAFADKTFAEKHKMTAMWDHKEWGFWDHSFDKLVPVKEYFDEHPEYFAYYNGARQKEFTQLCLTNPDVFDIAIKNLKKYIMKGKYKIWLKSPQRFAEKAGERLVKITAFPEW